jgi:hypothetical protein
MEAAEGVSATYFIHLHSSFYNALEPPIVEIFQEINQLGHDLGLHFDPPVWTDATDESVKLERRFLECYYGCELRALSIHNPDLTDWADARTTIAGLVNASAADLRATYGYVSDSNGIWRFRVLRDVLRGAEEARLQVLTHPEWWVPEPMSPRAKVTRAIEGRAAYTGLQYDTLLATSGRPNVG